MTRSKGLRLILLGIVMAISGLVLDAYLVAQYWANRPPFSTGPILVGTAGSFFFFPAGLLMIAIGVVMLIVRKSDYASWPEEGS